MCAKSKEFYLCSKKYSGKTWNALFKTNEAKCLLHFNERTILQLQPLSNGRTMQGTKGDRKKKFNFSIVKWNAI